jgi:hypothetical protein
MLRPQRLLDDGQHLQPKAPCFPIGTLGLQAIGLADQLLPFPAAIGRSCWLLR